MVKVLPSEISILPENPPSPYASFFVSNFIKFQLAPLQLELRGLSELIKYNGYSKLVEINQMKLRI